MAIFYDKIYSNINVLSELIFQKSAVPKILDKEFLCTENNINNINTALCILQNVTINNNLSISGNVNIYGDLGDINELKLLTSNKTMRIKNHENWPGSTININAAGKIITNTQITIANTSSNIILTRDQILTNKMQCSKNIIINIQRTPTIDTLYLYKKEKEELIDIATYCEFATLSPNDLRSRQTFCKNIKYNNKNLEDYNCFLLTAGTYNSFWEKNISIPVKGQEDDKILTVAKKGYRPGKLFHKKISNTSKFTLKKQSDGGIYYIDSNNISQFLIKANCLIISLCGGGGAGAGWGNQYNNYRGPGGGSGAFCVCACLFEDEKDIYTCQVGRGGEGIYSDKIQVPIDTYIYHNTTGEKITAGSGDIGKQGNSFTYLGGPGGIITDSSLSKKIKYIQGQKGGKGGDAAKKKTNGTYIAAESGESFSWSDCSCSSDITFFPAQSYSGGSATSPATYQYAGGGGAASYYGSGGSAPQKSSGTAGALGAGGGGFSSYTSSDVNGGPASNGVIELYY